jgi:thioredoxin-related protein
MLDRDFLPVLCRMQRHFILCLSYNVNQVKTFLNIQYLNKLNNIYEKHRVFVTATSQLLFCEIYKKEIFNDKEARYSRNTLRTMIGILYNTHK